MALQESLLVVCFKKNAAVAAFPGALEIGLLSVTKSNVSFAEDMSFLLPQPKLVEFYTIVEKLGKNLATETAEQCEIQLSAIESVSLDGNQLKKKKKNIESFAIDFDGFIYMDFLAAIYKVVLHISLPTKTQLDTMKKYNEKVGKAEADKCFAENVQTLIKHDCSMHEKLMLEEFLLTNETLIVFFCQIYKIVNIHE